MSTFKLEGQRKKKMGFEQRKGKGKWGKKCLFQNIPDCGRIHTGMCDGSRMI